MLSFFLSHFEDFKCLQSNCIYHTYGLCHRAFNLFELSVSFVDLLPPCDLSLERNKMIRNELLQFAVVFAHRMRVNLLIAIALGLLGSALGPATCNMHIGVTKMCFTCSRIPFCDSRQKRALAAPAATRSSISAWSTLQVEIGLQVAVAVAVKVGVGGGDGAATEVEVGSSCCPLRVDVTLSEVTVRPLSLPMPLPLPLALSGARVAVHVTSDLDASFCQQQQQQQQEEKQQQRQQEVNKQTKQK